MNKKVNTKTLNLIGSFVLLVLTLAGFAWLWQSSRPTDSVDMSQYRSVNITSLSSQAEDLVANKGNLSSMPLQPPAAELLGKTNPFE